MRDDLRIEASFLDHCPPTPYQVIDRLAAEGVEEVVILPLLLSTAFHARTDIPAVIDEARSRFPGLRIIASDVLGYDDTLLDVLDRRMRAELKDGRVRELDALVLACAGSSDTQANAAVARLARLWGQRHKLPVVAAFTTAASPSPAEAVLQWRLEGRRHVAVGSFFLAPGLLARPRRTNRPPRRRGRRLPPPGRQRRSSPPRPTPLRRSRPGPAHTRARSAPSPDAPGASPHRLIVLLAAAHRVLAR